MKLLSITLENFGAFAKTQTFANPDKPGLYFMQGVNQVDSRLGSNGAGKSTIWKALLWLIYGKTDEGLKAGDVCNWGVDKGTWVEAHFADGDDLIWIMKRTWKPNSWTLAHYADYVTDEEVIDLTKDPSNPVLAALGLEFTPFLHSILMAQSSPMFLDLKSDQQASLFSEVMGLERWIEASAKASKKASAQDAISRQLEREQAKIEGQLSAAPDYRRQAEEFDLRRAEELAEIEKDYERALYLARTKKEDLEALRKQYKPVPLVGLDEYETLAQERDELKADLRAAEKDHITSQHKVAEEESLLRFFGEHKSCPTCRQEITENLKSLMLVQGRARLIRHETHEGNAAELVEKMATRVREHEERVMERGRQIQAAKDEQDRLQRAERAAINEVELAERALDRLEDQAERLQSEVNPFKKLQSEANEEARRLREELARVNEALDESRYRHSLFSMWVKGFKDLRLQLISEALVELEIEVNSCVAALGLTDWELLFDVDKETKGGSIQRGFSVMVRSPLSTRVVPWEAWSGGERQRLRLAATMGLSNLIRTRTGADLPLEVWDEPSTHMSPEGVRDLLEALQRRAQVEQREIWVVDHTAHNFGGFEGGAVITKTIKGSSIRQY